MYIALVAMYCVENGNKGAMSAHIQHRYNEKYARFMDGWIYKAYRQGGLTVDFKYVQFIACQTCLSKTF